MFSFNMEPQTPPKLPSVKKQLQMIEEFLKGKTSFAVGSRVVLNKFGKTRYNLPRQGQVAVVASVYPNNQPHIDEEGKAVHGELVMAHGDGSVICYPVDFRYYEECKVDDTKVIQIRS